MSTETKAQHTPGPWYIQNGVVTAIITKERNFRGEDRIATIAQRNNEDEVDANARLIAQAPTMLEALKYALKALESPEARHVLAFTTEREQIRDAIAQAEPGNSP